MKCTKCGATVNGKGTCSKCGEAVQSASDKFDITYKTFGTSELLEIGPKRKTAEPVGTPSVNDTIRPRSKPPLRQKAAPKEKKTIFVAVAAVMLIVLMAGMFFWFFYARP
jgi:uncharacterized membrane protein YvbJ